MLHTYSVWSIDDSGLPVKRKVIILVIFHHFIFFLSGSLFTEEQGLEKLLNLKGAKIVSVRKPKPGVWRLMMNSNGSHTLRVTGFSSLSFTSGFGLRPIKSRDDAMPRPVAG